MNAMDMLKSPGTGVGKGSVSFIYNGEESSIMLESCLFTHKIFTTNDERKIERLRCSMLSRKGVIAEMPKAIPSIVPTEISLADVESETGDIADEHKFIIRAAKDARQEMTAALRNKILRYLGRANKTIDGVWDMLSDIGYGGGDVSIEEGCQILKEWAESNHE